MEAVRERVYAQMKRARTSHMARVRSAIVVALLIAALLWFTKWPVLRPGLYLLVIGQLAIILVLLRRCALLTREMVRLDKGVSEAPTFLGWFDEEARFSGRLGTVEDIVRTAGFAILGYGFWSATRSLLLALGLGVVYPALAYFAMERNKRLRARQALQREKDALTELASSANPGP